MESAVSMAKSLSSIEFVKALSAGSGTDSADFTGGRALAKEDLKDETILSGVNDKVIASLVSAIANGEIAGEEEAQGFLVDYGISKSDACDIVRAVCKKSNSFMEVFSMAEKAGITWDGIKNTLRKALGSEKPKDDEVPAGADGEPTNDDDEDEYEDATELVKSLTETAQKLFLPPILLRQTVMFSTVFNGFPTFFLKIN